MKEITCFKKNESEINKYIITIDTEKLLKIKDESIYKCGQKVKVSFNGYSLDKRGMYYQDLKEEFIQWVEHDGFPDSQLYRYTYTEFKKTYLSTLIDNIINGSINSINELMSLDTSKEFDNYNSEISKCLEDVSNISDKDYINKINALNKLKELYEKQEFNSDRQDIKKYYIDASNCIRINLVSTIDRVTFDRVMYFIDNKSYCDLNMDKLKLLKKGEN